MTIMTSARNGPAASAAGPPGERLVVGYARVSDDKTGVGGGVASQCEANEATAERRLGRGVDQTYSDNSISAHNGTRRPDFERLLADIAADMIGVVLLWRVNRIFRPEPEDIGQVGEFIALCRRHRVRVIAKSGEYDLESSDGRKAFLTDAVEAGYDSDQRGENVALARRRQARDAKWGGGVRPYGWGLETTIPQYQERNDGKRELLRPVGTDEEGRPVWLDMGAHRPDEAAEIRGWERDLFSGVTMKQITASMRERGVKTAAQADGRVLRRNGRVVESRGWERNSRTIVQILTHPRTSGHAVYRGEIIRRNAYPPIIPEDRRQALITMLKDPKRRTSPGNTPKWLGSLIYRCGVCNTEMRSDDDATMTVRYKEGKPVYRCRISGHCQRLLEPVDAYVESVIIERLSRPDIADLIPHAAVVDVTAIREQIVVLEARKQDAALRFAAGAIDGSMMATITAMIDAQLAELRADLKTSVAQSPLAEFVGADTEQVWKGLSLGRRREILRRLVTVTILPAKRGQRRFRPEWVVIAPVA